MTLYDALCTPDDISRYFKFKFDGASTPSLASVKEWINIATAMIYGVVSNVYNIPVTDENDLLILKELCIAYVRDKANFANGGNVYTVPQNNVSVPRTIKFTNFEESLKLISEGIILLANTGFNSSSLVYDYNYQKSNQLNHPHMKYHKYPLKHSSFG